MDTTRKYILLTILITAIIIVGFSVYYLFFSPIDIIKTNPLNNTKNAQREFSATLFFNRKAPKILKNIQITSTPSAVWNILVPEDGQSVKIFSQEELQAKTKYVLEINGKRITPYKFSFTTEAEKFGLGAPEAQNAFETYANSFPLLEMLPYKTEKYTIMQRQKDEYFVMVFGIYESETENIKKEVLAWFRSKGVDPISVTIGFVSAF